MPGCIVFFFLVAPSRELAELVFLCPVWTMMFFFLFGAYIEEYIYRKKKDQKNSRLLYSRQTTTSNQNKYN